MATMTPTTVDVSLTNTSGTCWSQSGSTKKYESNAGPASSNSTYLTVVVTSSDSSTCNYYMKGESTPVSSLTYTLPDGCEASSSGNLTYSWKLPSKTLYSIYGGVQKSTTWNCTLTYKYKSSEKTINISLSPSKSSGQVTWSGSSSGTNPGSSATTTFTCQIYLAVTNGGVRTEIGNVTMKGAVGYTSGGWQATVSYSNSNIKSTSSLSGTVLSLPYVTLNINSVAYSIHLSLSFS